VATALSKLTKLTKLTKTLVTVVGLAAVGAAGVADGRARTPDRKDRADGTFKATVAFKERGGWRVARAAGHGVAFVPVGSAAAAGLSLTLPKDRPVRGRILDLQGKPVSGATVEATNIGSFDSDAAADDSLKKATDSFNLFGGPRTASATWRSSTAVK
jgi:hypothetical protein